MILKIKKKAECIRNVANYSKLRVTDKIDKKGFDIQKFKDRIHITSPKLKELLKTIAILDKADIKNHNKLFKHIIYTDIKNSSAGSKIIAAGLVSDGYSNIYDKNLKIDNELLERNQYKNFALLCSVNIYDKSFPITLKKKILSTFNQRPDNVHGEQLRIIILDQGFKEGIDLFDVKYVHLFEPLITKADETQAIGRGTRFCGQKGLIFNPQTGWPLHVFKYELLLDDNLRDKFHVSNANELFLKNSGIDMNGLNFSSELEKISKYGAVDYELTKNIHEYSVDKNVYVPTEKESSNITGPVLHNKEDTNNDVEYTKYRSMGETEFSLSNRVTKPFEIKGSGIKGKKKKGKNIFLNKAPNKEKKFIKMREYIRERFSNFEWPEIKFENKCIDTKTKISRLIQYTPTQEFLSKYFNNTTSNKGLLLWHSVGTGKTCSAIAIASTGFEPHGYTILWVTRHTLKTEIWKNIFENVCSSSIKRKITQGENIPSYIPKNPLKYLPNWITPISYKQFTNMLDEKNDIYKMMKKKNGAEDPLKKTLVIIDEVHKLYSRDLPINERPNMKLLKEKIKKSYRVSGKDSVRLLLMTATPYTSDPMDLIKILNLMKEDDIPERFEDFSKEYLDMSYKFTDEGSVKYLDSISGYISYLNREKDIRQFAYPVYYQVDAYMSKKQLLDDNTKIELEKVQSKLKELKDISLKGKTKDEKTAIKDNISKLNLDMKNLKKKIKEDTKKTEDESQETSIENCLSKK